MKVAILGFGKEGQAAYSYWNKPENKITICDQNEKLELPEGVNRQLGENYLAGLDQFDLIVRSPSVHPKDITATNSPEILKKVTTNTNEFFKVSPSKNIIGVTGTKGKGTTSALICKMLDAAGKKVHLGGNIGIAPLDLLNHDIQPNDWVVLELSNFQLIDLNYSPVVAVCLMIAAEHQDWHGNVNEYIESKQRLFYHQTTHDFAIYFGLNDYSQHIASVSPGHKIPYMKSPGADVIEDTVTIEGQAICKTSELKLLGKHSWQNVCAAVTAVWQITQNVEAIRSVLITFSGLEHRLEFVRELNGVKYYDDSFGTTPETAQVAIEAFRQPKIIILGGSSKGADFAGLAKTVKNNNVRKVLLIGKESPKIKAALEAVSYKDYFNGGKSMSEIIQTARSQAQTGDVVLLSTACASFDMFKDYKDRGDQFKAAVLKLA